MLALHSLGTPLSYWFLVEADVHYYAVERIGMYQSRFLEAQGNSSWRIHFPEAADMGERYVLFREIHLSSTIGTYTTGQVTDEAEDIYRLWTGRTDAQFTLDLRRNVEQYYARRNATAKRFGSSHTLR
jgi:histone deacetylase complex regulatory component SIN3